MQDCACRDGQESGEVLQAVLLRLQHLCQLQALLEQSLEAAQLPLRLFPALRACMQKGGSAPKSGKVRLCLSPKNTDLLFVTPLCYFLKLGTVSSLLVLLWLLR